MPLWFFGHHFLDIIHFFIYHEPCKIPLYCVSTHYQPCSSCVHFSLCFGVLSRMCVYLWSRPANGFYFINSICFSAEIKYLTLRLWHTSVFALVSTAEQCCDQCVNVKEAAACVYTLVSYSVLYNCICSSQHDMISQCTVSAYRQLFVHAQLWCQSLCGKPWCMEWGACWAVWVCCCHDNHPLNKCAAQKGDWVYARV